MRYRLVGFGFGLVWYVVLQLPRGSREFIAGLGQLWAAALLCLASLVVALLLRRFIVDEANDVRLAVIGPFVGAALFGYAVAVTIWVQNGFHSLNYVDLFVLMPLWVIFGAAMYFPIVIPTGYLAQRVMRGVNDRRVDVPEQC